MQYGLWSFQTGGTKLERFLPKNQHTQRKSLNFENWINGEVSKVPKFHYSLVWCMEGWKYLTFEILIFENF